MMGERRRPPLLLIELIFAFKIQSIDRYAIE